MAVDPTTGVFEYEESTAVGTTWSGYMNKGMTPIKLALQSILATFTSNKIADSGWINLPLVNSWTSSLSETPQYRKLNGAVYFRGVATGGSNATLATLPAGYRPLSTIRMLVRAATSTTTTTWLQIDPSGLITTATGASPNLNAVSSFIADS